MRKKSRPTDGNIPDKLYFKIGEVSKIAGLPAYVLRFWESEFSCIRPKRTPTGHRLYRRADVESILEIKNLLHKKRFTLEGARKHLAAPKKTNPGSRSEELLKTVRDELEEIRDLLDS
jgi:DNA-binding transcriptional MerR regulator